MHTVQSLDALPMLADPQSLSTRPKVGVQRFAKERVVRDMADMQVLAEMVRASDIKAADGPLAQALRDTLASPAPVLNANERTEGEEDDVDFGTTEDTHELERFLEGNPAFLADDRAC